MGTIAVIKGQVKKVGGMLACGTVASRACADVSPEHQHTSTDLNASQTNAKRELYGGTGSGEFRTADKNRAAGCDKFC